MKKTLTCTIQEASDLSGLSCYCIKKLATSNSIVSVKSGRKTYINRESRINYLAGAQSANSNNDLNTSDEKPNKLVSADKDILEKRKANGICVDCKADFAEPGQTRCKACSEKHKAQRRERDEIRRKQGLCIKCGDHPAITGTDFCELCKTKQKLSAKKNYDNGLKQRIQDIEAENRKLRSVIKAIYDNLNCLDIFSEVSR